MSIIFCSFCRGFKITRCSTGFLVDLAASKITFMVCKRKQCALSTFSTSTKVSTMLSKPLAELVFAADKVTVYTARLVTYLFSALFAPPFESLSDVHSIHENVFCHLPVLTRTFGLLLRYRMI
jgi:hypothetical protein